MLSRFIISVPIAIVTGLVCLQAAFGALSVEKIKGLVRAGEVLPAAYRQQVDAEIYPDYIALSLFRNPDASQRDCKIDAVLLAKLIMDAEPGALKRLKVLFYEFSAPDSYWEIDVPAGTVRAFARRAIGVEDLLKAIRLFPKQGNQLARLSGLSYKAIVESLGVVDGPLKDDRACLRLRIDALAHDGKDVVPLRDAFLHAEDLARRGKEQALSVQIKDLTRLVDEHVLQGGDKSHQTKLLSLSGSDLQDAMENTNLPPDVSDSILPLVPPVNSK